MPRSAALPRNAAACGAMLLFTAALLYTLAGRGSIAVSARLANILGGRRVVIDPGHGGPDPGAVGRSGLREKDLVLEIALHLQRRLGRAGVYVYMVRETDRDFGLEHVDGPYATRKRRDLAYRIALANKARADIYLSIHANSIPDARWSGAQVFFNPARPMARELAVCLQSALVAELGPNRRQALPADYRVLNEVEMPAATVEVGFLSNPREEALLSSAAYRERVAEAIYQGVVRYFQLLAERGNAAPSMAIPVAIES